MNAFDLLLLDNHVPTLVKETFAGEFPGAITRSRQIITGMQAIFPQKQFSVKLIPIPASHHSQYYYVTSQGVSNANYQQVELPL